MDQRRILFLCPYPPAIVASQRFRFEQYFDVLKDHGFSYEVEPFTSSKGWQTLSGKANVLLKLTVLLSALIQRFLILPRVFDFSYIFIHREAAPVGPPVIEWIIARLLKKRLIYDFDDAIWATDDVNEPRLLSFMRWRSKVSSICKWSYKVSAGNSYLASYALQFSARVIINPTTINTRHVHNPDLYEPREQLKKQNGIARVVIGWTGSHSTLKYLEQLLPVLQRVEAAFPDDVDFLVIADLKPEMALKNLQFRAWSNETEIKDLLLADIGIMPLPDDQWAKGKCGFKALQYMALEIPAVVSPVGVNTTIVTPNVNGFLCNTSDEWFTCLSRLIQDRSLRVALGKQGRITVNQSYSTDANSSVFLSLFQS
jgi:glycosyltransferase involved in cell wall biosynthesis